MDSILQKFYNGGNTSLNNGFTQFGALQSNATKPIGLTHTSKSPLPVRPLINSVNTTYHKPSLTINTNFNHLVTNKDFLCPKNLAFNSSSDLIYNNPGNVQRRYNSEYDIRKNTYADIRRNDTKMQMMEEKMKNLELKSQRLEVINDFFFDMFENNLVKEELKRQKGIKEEKKKKNEEDNYENEDTEEYKEKKENKKKKKYKMKKKELTINPEFINDEETLVNVFKEQTDKFSRKYLNNVKTDIGLSLVEHQLKKNEVLNNITEDILDLKGELMNKLNRMEMKQRAEMKTIAYCLQNSGDDLVENLATRLFSEDILKPEEEILKFNTAINSMSTTGLQFTGSAFNNTNLFKTNIGSIKRRASIESNNDEKKTRIRFKDDENTTSKTVRRKSMFYTKKNSGDVILEEKDEAE